jgi:hypothetical protein
MHKRWQLLECSEFVPLLLIIAAAGGCNLQVRRPLRGITNVPAAPHEFVLPGTVVLYWQQIH